MSIPAIIYLSLTGIGLLASAYMHGKPREGVYNFWVSAVATVITFGLLFWGGFFG